MNARFHVVNALLLAGLLIGSLLVWPDLPERIPAHFGADGEVLRWESRSLLGWLLLPLMALAIVALDYGAAMLLPRRPGLFNNPDKAAFLALTPERRAPVIARMQEFLYGISALVLLLFVALQWMRYRTALGADPKPYIAFTLVFGLMITPVSLGLWLPAISREIKEQTRRQQADGRTSPEPTRG